MSDLDLLPARTVPAHMGQVRISVDAVIAQWHPGTCKLPTIRVAAKTRVWNMGFGLAIPANGIAGRLDDVPRDRRLVVAWPSTDRSGIVRRDLTARGADARSLNGGPLGLADALKGTASETLPPEPGK